MPKAPATRKGDKPAKATKTKKVDGKTTAVAKRPAKKAVKLTKIDKEINAKARAARMKKAVNGAKPATRPTKADKREVGPRGVAGNAASVSARQERAKAALSAARKADVPRVSARMRVEGGLPYSADFRKSVLKLRDFGMAFEAIGKYMGCAPGLAQLAVKTHRAELELGKGDYPTATFARLKQAREKDLLSWGDVAARFGLRESQIKRMYADGGGDVTAKLFGENGIKQPDSKNARELAARAERKAQRERGELPASDKRIKKSAKSGVSATSERKREARTGGAPIKTVAKTELVGDGKGRATGTKAKRAARASTAVKLAKKVRVERKAEATEMSAGKKMSLAATKKAATKQPVKKAAKKTSTIKLPDVPMQAKVPTSEFAKMSTEDIVAAVDGKKVTWAKSLGDGTVSAKVNPGSAKVKDAKSGRELGFTTKNGFRTIAVSKIVKIG